MKLFVSTVIRNAPIQNSGELLSVDWKQKRIIQRVVVTPNNPMIEHDPNPRGNSRGCRGVVEWKDAIVAADYHTLHIFDKNLSPVRTISHPLMVGLHEIFLSTYEEDVLYVTSTAIDAVLKVCLSTGMVLATYWPRECVKIQKALSIEPLAIDKSSDNRLRFLENSHIKASSHLHLNAVAEHSGKVLGLFNRFGAVVDLLTGDIVFRDQSLVHPHNLATGGNGKVVYINNSWEQQIHGYDVASGALVNTINLKKFWRVRSLYLAAWFTNVRNICSSVRRPISNVAKPLFLRGLQLAHGFLWAGISPGTILQIDCETGELVDCFTFSRDVHVCVHGLEIEGRCVSRGWEGRRRHAEMGQSQTA